ncbi:V-type proton ATPase subunit e [Diutina catenulata]
MSGWAVVIMFLVTAAASVAAWFLAPRENRTVWRSSLILTFSLLYLSWAITYLAQLHPLEFPKSSTRRPEL